MPRGEPKNVKDLSAYSLPPKTRMDVAYALKSHFFGLIEWHGVEDFIGTLPVQYQQALRLCYEEYRSQEESAEVMGCSSCTVKVYLAKGRDLILEWVKAGQTT
jgi:DNA-directed RNA polymerase specialized sigma24 family protein